MNYRSQTVSAVIITHNHLKSLEKCLDSLKWVDEIIIIDQGSTDGTLDLARRYTQKIYFHPAKQASVLRNYAFQLAKCDWVISLEPYEWVEEMLKHEIDGILLNPQAETTGYAIARHLYFQGHGFGHAGPWSKREVRLFKKRQGRALDGPHQHQIQVNGDVQKLDRKLGSAPYANLQEWFESVNQRSTLAAYDALERGKANASTSLFGLIWAMKWAFFVQFIVRQGFKDGIHGLTAALAQMLEQYQTTVKIRSLTKARS